MPTFEYKATNSAGQVIAGTLEVASANDAVSVLGSQGLRVDSIQRRLTDRLQAQDAPVPSRSVQAPPQVAPVQMPQGVSKPISQGAQLSTQSQKEVRTRVLKESETFLIIAQLSNLIRSGISPAQAFDRISQNESYKQDVRDAFSEMARDTSSGLSSSDAMAKYPDLFSPGTVGSVRAGEQGGYLWEAMESVAGQMQEVGKLKKFTWWMNFTLITTIGCFPFIFIAGKGIDSMIGTINTGENTTQALMKGMGQAFFGPWGIIAALLIVGWLFIGYNIRQARWRELRHGMAKNFPLVNKRTKGVCLEALVYHYDRCVKAGLSPQRSWSLAIHALPNVAVSRQMVEESGVIREDTPLSQILAQSTVFPEQFKPYIETSEMSGTTEQAMQSVLDYASAERKTADTIIRVKLGIWIVLVSICVTMLLFGILFRLYIDSAFNQILGDV